MAVRMDDTERWTTCAFHGRLKKLKSHRVLFVVMPQASYVVVAADGGWHSFTHEEDQRTCLVLATDQTFS